MNGSRFLACIADASRYQLLCALLEGPRCVGELVGSTGQTQSNVSHHLKRLRDCGLVIYDREGKQNVYRLSSDAVAHFLRTLEATQAAVAPLCAEAC